jgi:hypothetical protein
MDMKTTEKGFQYVEHGGFLIQQDRYGNWNIFVGGIFRESCANLPDAMEKAGLTKLESIR